MGCDYDWGEERGPNWHLKIVVESQVDALIEHKKGKDAVIETILQAAEVYASEKARR